MSKYIHNGDWGFNIWVGVGDIIQSITEIYFSILWSLAGWSGTGVGLHTSRGCLSSFSAFRGPHPKPCSKMTAQVCIPACRKENGRAETLPSTKGACQKLHRPILLTSYWPEFNHMATPSYKRLENVSLYKTPSACLNFWFCYWHLHKPNLINKAFTCM